VPYLNLALKLLVVPIALWLLASNVGRDARIGFVTVDGTLLAVALLVNQAALTLFAVRMRSAMRCMRSANSGPR